MLQYFDEIDQEMCRPFDQNIQTKIALSNRFLKPVYLRLTAEKG